MVDVRKILRVSKYQHDQSDCGVACLASLIEFYGGKSEIARLREASGTTDAGTTLLGLYEAAEKYGLIAKGYEGKPPDIIEYDNPLILHVNREEGFNHYVLCYGYNKNMFIIWDPAKGIEKWTLNELEKFWISNKCLGVKPGKFFKTQKTHEREKRKWFFSIIKDDIELILAGVIAGIFISLLGLVMAIFSQRLLDSILPSKNIPVLFTIVLVVFFLLSFRVLLSSLRYFIFLLQGKIFNIRIINRFYTDLLFLPKQFFDTRKTGEFIARLNDTGRIQKLISEIAGNYIIDLLISISSLGLLFYYSVSSGLFSVVFLPAYFLIVFKWNKDIIRGNREVMESYAMSESNYVDTLKGITEIKSYGKYEHFEQQNNRYYSNFQDQVFNLGKIRIRVDLIIGLLGTLYIFLILFYNSTMVIKMNCTTGELMAIITVTSNLLPSIINLSMLSFPLNESKVAFSRMYEYANIKHEKIPDDEPDLQNIDIISIKDLKFRYPGQKLLLSDLNMDIKKGEISTLSGASGCGKSTIANILERFYQVESGIIIINDGIDYETINLATWRKKIAYIPQKIHIFNGTICENISFCKDVSQYPKVNDFLVQKGLDRLFMKFPGGISTIVGEGGITLSGGEVQMIAFSRAMFHNPEFLIIDEGTSSMDTDLEQSVIGLINELKSEMGILFIAHKLNIINNIADNKYIIKNGKVEKIMS